MESFLSHNDAQLQNKYKRTIWGQLAIRQHCACDIFIIIINRW